jgi:hypothetical protein
MNKIITMLCLLLVMAGASFSQTLVADAKPASSTSQIGAYGVYEVSPSSDSNSGYAGINPVPFGFVLQGTYTKLTIEMTTPVPSGETDNVIFGIWDKTTDTYMTCSLAVSDKSCVINGGSHYNGTSWESPTSVTFAASDQVFFTIYIPGSGHTGYTVQNLTWRLE